MKLLAFAAPLACVAPTMAHADVTISSASTHNMSCSSGICAPTAKKAVLNVTDLETMLASGNVTVTTTGPGVQADNLDVNAAVSWAGANALALDAHQSCRPASGTKASNACMFPSAGPATHNAK
jgi:hypothetical protein